MTAEQCPVCDGTPRVLVAVTHPTMRQLILELLEREHGCWDARSLDADLPAAMRHLEPDLVIIDSAGFPDCCSGPPDGYPRQRVVVVGPEPDDAYMTAAFDQGAGGWLARDDVAERLSVEMRRALGCIHDPCPTPRGTGRTWRLGRSPQPGPVATPDASDLVEADDHPRRKGSR